MKSCRWTILRRKRPFLTRHVLVVADYSDLNAIVRRHLFMFEYVVFAFERSDYGRIDLDEYFMQVVDCEDNMRQLRCHLKMAYKTTAIGHMYVVNEKIPMYAFLKEWYVLNFLEIYQVRNDSFAWETPHVIVFDLDSTLITDEQHVQIRDEFVYESLYELKSKGCVLVLWSYGNREHVTHSLEQTELTNFFDITLCGGYKTGDDDTARQVIVNLKSDKVFVKTPFYLDIEDRDRLPKSPRIVLWYLRKNRINVIKSITLVDDLKDNDYNYDYFVNVRKCPEPRNDWSQYHDAILANIEQHESYFGHAQKV